MLLCVGTFFTAGDDCKTQWQKLINGELKGEYMHMWSSVCKIYNLSCTVNNKNWRD